MQRQTMRQLTDLYAAMRANAGKAKRTVANESYALQHMAAWWDATRRVPKSLCPSDVESYLYAPGTGLAGQASAATFNWKLSVLGPFLSWAHRRGDVQPGLLDVLNKRPVERKDKLQLSLRQIVDMIEGCDDEWERWALILASQTLCRAGEIRPLRLANFNLDTLSLTLRRFKTRDDDLLPITGDLDDGYRRWVTWLQEHVGRQAAGDWYALPRRASVGQSGTEWVYFPNEWSGTRLSPVVRKHAARVLGVRSDELLHQGIHLIRRSMARALYEQLKAQGHGDPKRVVMTALGHSSPATTEIYLGIRADREERDSLLRGSRMLWVEQGDNVVRLRDVG